MIKMTAITFSQFVTDCFTRDQGKLAREKLLEAIENDPKEERVTISLAGVDTMTPSFVDECFGKLLLQMGSSCFRNRISFADANETIIALLNAVLSKRAKEVPSTL